MVDITMCVGEGCPLREECYRYKAPVNEHWQAYFVHVPYDKESNSCDMLARLQVPTS